MVPLVLCMAQLDGWRSCASSCMVTPPVRVSLTHPTFDMRGGHRIARGHPLDGRVSPLYRTMKRPTEDWVPSGLWVGLTGKRATDSQSPSAEVTPTPSRVPGHHQEWEYLYPMPTDRVKAILGESAWGLLFVLSLDASSTRRISRTLPTRTRPDARRSTLARSASIASLGRVALPRKEDTLAAGVVAHAIHDNFNTLAFWTSLPQQPCLDSE